MKLLMIKIVDATTAFLGDESGLTMVEYAIAGGAIAAVVVGGFTDIGSAVANAVSSITDGF